MKGLACFLELLGDDRTNINDQDTYYRTPLHRCIEWSLKDFVRALLAKQGINVNAVDSGGLTPLHCAVQGEPRGRLCHPSY
jgi:ankyrin repeat protein